MGPSYVPPFIIQPGDVCTYINARQGKGKAQQNRPKPRRPEAPITEFTAFPSSSDLERSFSESLGRRSFPPSVKVTQDLDKPLRDYSHLLASFLRWSKAAWVSLPRTQIINSGCIMVPYDSMTHKHGQFGPCDLFR